MDALRLAVIGVGALGRHHARILSTLDGVQLVAVADPNESQAQSVATSCGCDWTADYRTLLGRVDAVSIVVPTFLHRAVATDFLQHGIPVLVEKPLAGNVADGRAIVDLADERGAALQVGHIERFNPAFERLAAFGGAPKYIRAERLSPYSFRSMDIGVVHDLMIHDLDLVLSLVKSNIVRTEAFGVCLVGGHEDCVQARLTFANGCIADLTANRVCPGARRSLQLWTDNGCVTADLHQRKLTEFRPGDALLSGALPFELARQPGADIAALKSQMFEHFFQVTETSASDADALTAELSSFIAAVRNGATPAVDGHQALAALDAAAAVLDAVQHHAWDGTPHGRLGPHAHPIHHQQRRAA